MQSGSSDPQNFHYVCSMCSQMKATVWRSANGDWKLSAVSEGQLNAPWRACKNYFLPATRTMPRELVLQPAGSLPASYEATRMDLWSGRRAPQLVIFSRTAEAAPTSGTHDQHRQFVGRWFGEDSLCPVTGRPTKVASLNLRRSLAWLWQTLERGPRGRSRRIRARFWRRTVTNFPQTRSAGHPGRGSLPGRRFRGREVCSPHASPGRRVSASSIGERLRHRSCHG